MNTIKTTFQVTALAVVTSLSFAQENTVSTRVGDLKVVTTVNTSSNTVRKAEVKKVVNQEWKTNDAKTEKVDEVMDEEVEFLESTITLQDCNNNGIDDLEELDLGLSDENFNSAIDDCEFDYGDLNLDQTIDRNDVFILLGWFGTEFPLFGDLNKDGVVDSEDLGLILARWGQSPF